MKRDWIVDSIEGLEQRNRERAEERGQKVAAKRAIYQAHISRKKLGQARTYRKKD